MRPAPHSMMRRRGGNREEALPFAKTGGEGCPQLVSPTHEGAQHPLMSRSQRTAPHAAGIVFAGAVVGWCAVSVAAPAYASGLAMTPQPVLSCTSPDAVPPAEAQPAPGPVDNVASPPPPGSPPYVPPVASGNGPEPLSQLGYLREIWHEFHNGVPPDLLYGPAPTDAPASPPEGPLPPLQNP